MKTLLKINLQQSLAESFGINIEAEITESKFADYQSNIAFILSKQLGMQPKEIAATLLSKLNNEIFTAEISGAGFINFHIKSKYLDSALNSLEYQKTTNPQNIIIDFSSPNIAKEMHVGHLRSTLIGDAIANLLEYQGHYVTRINHIGDWGTQFGMLIAYIKKNSIQLDNLSINEITGIYKQSKLEFDQDADFQTQSRLEVVKLQSGDTESLSIWEILCEKSKDDFSDIYDLLDIKLLKYKGESTYKDLIPTVLENLEANNLIQEDQGAKCIFLGETPAIIQKSDGGYNYMTTDLAALYHRIFIQPNLIEVGEKADKIIYITDAGQSNHFAQLFAIAKAAQWTKDVELIHIPFGLVLGENGKKFKTRSGETIALKSLINQAIEKAGSQNLGIASIKYAELSQNRMSDYIFSYDKMLQLKGNTAIYLLYSYSRMRGILIKNTITATDIQLFEQSEIDLAKHLLKFEDAINESISDFSPNKLADYLYQLSQKFNNFYENCEISDNQSRLNLTKKANSTLTEGLKILGIKPQKISK